MDGLILSIIIGAIRSIPDLANRVYQVISGLWGTLTYTFGRWVGAFQYVANQAFRLFQALYYLALAIGTTLLWFLTIALPRTLVQAGVNALVAIGHSVGSVINWVNGLVHDLEQRLLSALSDLRGWAIQGFGQLWGQVTTLWNRFLAVEHLVAQLLTNPRALADWLAGQIVQAVIRYATANGSVLFGLFRRNAVRLTLSAASILETIITQAFM